MGCHLTSSSLSASNDTPFVVSHLFVAHPPSALNLHHLHRPLDSSTIQLTFSSSKVVELVIYSLQTFLVQHLNLTLSMFFSYVLEEKEGNPKEVVCGGRKERTQDWIFAAITMCCLETFKRVCSNFTLFVESQPIWANGHRIVPICFERWSCLPETNTATGWAQPHTGEGEWQCEVDLLSDLWIIIRMYIYIYMITYGPT